jgi:copper chaperone CopZ
VKKLDKRKVKTESCCNTDNSKRNIGQGIFYGIIPHIGCIAFIIGSVLGATVLTQLFRPLLMNRYFFYILIGISFLFATISSIIYLKKQGFITSNRDKGRLEINVSSQIFKRKWKYLSTMYGSTIGVNLLLFLVIFPLLANVSLFSTSVAGASTGISSLSSIKLKVDIPCSGHASLISGELKTINGVDGVQFSLPNTFNVIYDSAKTSKDQILSLEVFKTYKATVLSESDGVQQTNQINVESLNGNSGSNSVATTGDVQKVQFSVSGSTYYPYPIRVKKGIPVQLIADMNNMPGCSRSIVIPEFGIRKIMSEGDNVIEFTPDKSGTFQFFCSMNMYRGQIIVEEADGSVAAYTGNTSVPSVGSYGGSGCGCG